MARLTLVLGGVRSGKSRHAEQLAAADPPVTYLATGQAGDAEMSRRIAEHRQRRPLNWLTVEEPSDVASVIARLAGGSLLLECVTLWLTNLLVGLPGRAALDDAAIRAQLAAVMEAVAKARGQIIMVSNEVGCGVMPVNELARRFGDLLGEANQRFAAVAAEVYWCVAGLPVRIKGEAGMRGDSTTERL
jgi:adenosylcobinamide kinase/adenosylcobinamide-phosphate guanylyltransferase